MFEKVMVWRSTWELWRGHKIGDGIWRVIGRTELMAGAWNGLSGPKHVVNGSNLLNHAEAAVDGGGGSVLKVNWVLTCFDHCGERVSGVR